MNFIVLTKSSTFIIGPVAELLGILMNGIFSFLEMVGIPNIGLTIILFTLIIYLLMAPLTIKQQKFSKLSAKMNPEIQAIQKKYQGKKDNDSMMKMNEETKAVYEKYGTSPTGSCLQLLIQMPILFALYRVIANVPAYVPNVKKVFEPLVQGLMSTNGAQAVIQELGAAKGFGKYDYTAADTFVDVLNKLSTAELADLSDKFPNLSGIISDVSGKLAEMNNFLGINIANSPSFIMKDAVAAGSVILIIGALSIPVLAALTQWLNTKLMPQPETGNSQEPNTMASSMKTMNVMMPIMSAVFCFTLPAGMGLYWIAGAVIRSIQQIAINKHLDHVDFDQVVKKNIEKAGQKREKKGLPPQSVSTAAKINTKGIDSKKSSMTEEERAAKLRTATEYYNNQTAKPGSIAAKANMVKQYNEKNNK